MRVPELRRTSKTLSAALLSMLLATLPAMAQEGSAHVAPTILAGLVHGLTQRQVEARLGARGEHEFTAALSNAVVRCVSYYRNDVYGHYYLVFTNDCLARVCRPPPFEMRQQRYGRGWANYRVLGDPEARIGKVLGAQDMIGPRLVAALKPVSPPKQHVDPGLTAALLLARRGADREKQDEWGRQFNALLRRYDPYGITLGSTVSSVEDRLGKPHTTERLPGDRQIRYYGSVEFGRVGQRELMWVSVVYQHAKVIRVFSRDFLDEDKVRQLEGGSSQVETVGSRAGEGSSRR